MTRAVCLAKLSTGEPCPWTRSLGTDLHALARIHAWEHPGHITTLEAN